MLLLLLTGVYAACLLTCLVTVLLAYLLADACLLLLLMMLGVGLFSRVALLCCFVCDVLCGAVFFCAVLCYTCIHYAYKHLLFPPFVCI